MPVEAGTRLGPYEIVSRIGAGGMGEVFRARDTRLDRTVAIKVLPSHLSSNPQLRDRFEREARAISSLNHPNICQLYDVGETSSAGVASPTPAAGRGESARGRGPDRAAAEVGGTTLDTLSYLVMEYLEGESLADRLARGPLPLDQVLRYGAQLADALAKAHRQGIIHRDLKPGNIMITKSGVKLLDFGLAKTAAAGAVSSPDAPTEQQQKPLTAEGTLLGTFQYMAPEQLAGEEADTRTDIFALGVVLYEMATGRRAFEGKTRTSLIASIVGGQPRPLAELQPMTPPALEHVIARCLEKEPDERWQSASDVASELRWIESGESAAAAVTRRRHPAVTWILGATTLALLIACGVLLARLRGGDMSPAAARVELDIVPGASTSFDPIDGPVIVSPDGQFIAAKLEPEGIAVRSIASRELRVLPHPGYDFFWSADSRSLGYFAQGKLYRADIAGGSPRTLASVGDSRGGTWSSAGVILFAAGADTGLSRVSENGGPVTSVTTVDPRTELGHWRPYFFPDGEHFLFFSRGRKAGTSGVYVGSLGTKKTTLLMKSETAPVLAHPDILLFLHESSVLAQRIDTNEWKLTGSPRVVAENVEYAPHYGSLAVSAASNGVFAYQERSEVSRTAIVQLDRTGKEIATLTDDGGSNLDLSEDDTKLAYNRSDARSRTFDIWMLDLGKKVTSRLTFSPSSDYGPVWSPDGTQVAFGSDRESGMGIYIRSSSGAETLLFPSPASISAEPVDWSRDGRYLLYEPGGGNDLFLLPLAGGRAQNPIPLAVDSTFSEHTGRFSPDSRFAVYTSTEGGRDEIYVQPVPPTGAKWQLTTQGGTAPRWRGDGKEIVYVWNDKLFSIAVTTSPHFEASAPRELFTVNGREHIISSDGETFYVTRSDRVRALPIRVVLNWKLPDS